MCDDLLNCPVCSQSQHRLPACPQSTTLTWWWPTCGPSCRSLRRKTLGCRKELRTWKRRGTSSGVSWTASSSPQRARDRNRVRASTVMVRSETGVRWACTANLESSKKTKCSQENCLLLDKNLTLYRWYFCLFRLWTQAIQLASKKGGRSSCW